MLQSFSCLLTVSKMKNLQCQGSVGSRFRNFTEEITLLNVSAPDLGG